MSHQYILYNSYSGYAFLTGLIEEAVKSKNMPVEDKRNLLRAMIECHEANPIRNSAQWVEEWKALHSALNTYPQCI